MSEIGATLQSARTRAGLDISDIEAETKIRAKYLRALEQEEWDQLPGTTYVRSFLRTYADALGLDGRMMVEQYRLRHEHPTDQDLMPIVPQRRSSGRQEGRRPPRGAVIGLLVVLLLGALWWLGSRGSDDPPKAKPSSSATTTTEPAASSSSSAKPAAKTVRLQVRGTGSVFVCIQDATGKVVADGLTLTDGSRTRTFRSKAFRVRLGNGEARLIVNGRSRRVADASPQAYRVSTFGVKPIALNRSPACTPG